MENLYTAKGATEEQIIAAEKDLNLTFPVEYREYLKEFGAISFYGTELTGLNVDSYINVVDATNSEKKLNKKFPNDYFVLENFGIDGELVLMNTKGKVFLFKNGEMKELCENFREYIKLCLERKK
ncbi:SMI1/KNR4 family protein [Gemella bergeri]